MSSLWTPSGEHPVDRPGAGPASGSADAPTAADAAGAPPGTDRELTPEERAAAEEYGRQIDAAREQLLAAPAGLVVGQQALQFYELAALHLSQPEPRLDDARIAIDALAGVVERVGPRLGEAEPALRQALNQLQLAFVEVSGEAGARAPGEPPSPG
ncbi:MAG TPA: hypothetical protein VFR26_05910 [Acidimicrobiales bacterium]|jgi:hypothetical protein|nr:hypothetical protein [Acidimicrobiales bacterium]